MSFYTSPAKHRIKVLMGLLLCSLLGACHFIFQHPLSEKHLGPCPVGLVGKWEQDMTGPGRHGDAPGQFEITISPDCKTSEMEFGGTKKRKINFNLVFTEINKKFYVSATTTHEINEHQRYMVLQYSHITPTHFNLYYEKTDTVKASILERKIEGHLNSEDKPVVTAKGKALLNFIAANEQTIFSRPVLYRKTTHWSPWGKYYGKKRPPIRPIH